MTIQTIPRSRPTPRGSDHLIVASAGGTEVVHLALDHGEPAPLTLCVQTASSQRPTRLFHESGCYLCASVALNNGHVAAREGHRATVNLRRWWARRWLRSQDQQLS